MTSPQENVVAGDQPPPPSNLEPAGVTPPAPKPLPPPSISAPVLAGFENGAWFFWVGVVANFMLTVVLVLAVSLVRGIVEKRARDKERVLGAPLSVRHYRQRNAVVFLRLWVNFNIVVLQHALITFGIVLLTRFMAAVGFGSAKPEKHPLAAQVRDAVRYVLAGTSFHEVDPEIQVTAQRELFLAYWAFLYAWLLLCHRADLGTMSKFPCGVNANPTHVFVTRNSADDSYAINSDQDYDPDDLYQGESAESFQSIASAFSSSAAQERDPGILRHLARYFVNPGDEGEFCRIQTVSASAAETRNENRAPSTRSSSGSMYPVGQRGSGKGMQGLQTSQFVYHCSLFVRSPDGMSWRQHTQAVSADELFDKLLMAPESSGKPASYHKYGLTTEGVQLSRERYGSNNVSPPQKSTMALFYEKCTQGFFFSFSLQSVYLQMNNFLIHVTASYAIWFLWNKVSEALHASKSTAEMVRTFEPPADTQVSVVRNSEVKLIKPSQIVVGDVVELRAGDTLAFDGLLLAGNVTMNEAGRTGECMPVNKVPIDFAAADSQKRGRLTTSLPSPRESVAATAPEAGKRLMRQRSTSRFNGALVKDETADMLKFDSSNMVYAGTVVNRVLVPDKKIHKNPRASVSGKDDAAATTPYTAFAVVKAIGTGTHRGELTRDMFFPDVTSHVVELEEELALLYILNVFCVCVFTVFFFFWNWNRQPFYVICWLSVTTLNQLLHPFLPVAWGLSSRSACKRLKEKNVQVLEPERLALAGMCDYFVFDKTGTLTEESMIFDGLTNVCEDKVCRAFSLAAAEKALGSTSKGKSDEGLYGNALQKFQLWLGLDGLRSLECLACCNTLFLQEGGRPEGHPVEMQMLEASGWRLDMVTSTESRVVVQTPALRMAIRLKRKWKFDAKTTIQVVLVYVEEATAAEVDGGGGGKGLLNSHRQMIADEQGKWFAFVKGSMEAIASICSRNGKGRSATAVAHKEAVAHMKQGKYVIAMACAEIPKAEALKFNLATLHRQELEARTDFVPISLLMFGNKVKDETPKLLAALQRGGVKPLMCSGDALYTSAKIALDCGLLPNVETLQQLSKEDGVPFSVPGSRLSFNDIASTTKQQLDEQEYYSDNEEKPLLERDDSGEAVMWVLDMSEEKVLAFDGCVPELRSLSSDRVESWIVFRSAIFAFSEERSWPLTRGLAISQKCFDWLEENDLPALMALAPFITVFGRFGPNGKKRVVAMLQRMTGQVVGYCGDGGNDAAAAKQAHVGMALIDTSQNSLAAIAAPIIVTDRRIDRVVSVLCDGRAVTDLNVGMLRYFQTMGLLFICVAKLWVVEQGGFTHANFFFMADVCFVPLICWALPKQAGAEELRGPSPNTVLLGRKYMGPLCATVLMLLGMHQLLRGYGILRGFWLPINFDRDEISRTNIPVQLFGRGMTQEVGLWNAYYMFFVFVVCASLAGMGRRFRAGFHTNWRLYFVWLVVCLVSILPLFLTGNKHTAWANVFSRTNLHPEENVQWLPERLPPFVRPISLMFALGSPDGHHGAGRAFLWSGKIHLDAVTGKEEPIDAEYAGWLNHFVPAGKANPIPKPCSCDGELPENIADAISTEKPFPDAITPDKDWDDLFGPAKTAKQIFAVDGDDGKRRYCYLSHRDPCSSVQLPGGSEPSLVENGANLWVLKHNNFLGKDTEGGDVWQFGLVFVFGAFITFFLLYLFIGYVDY
ncbi:unnamed protein product [Amoebophrya sp. A25]|nr:unnamed protein product [Amoebophrya sp. A25]|eukprot:GSA25T00016062001.1